MGSSRDWDLSTLTFICACAIYNAPTFTFLKNLRLVGLFTTLDVDNSKRLSREEFRQGMLVRYFFPHSIVTNACS